MGEVFKSLLNGMWLYPETSLVRCTIKEDEKFGEAVITNIDGTPSLIVYDLKTGKWI